MYRRKQYWPLNTLLGWNVPVLALSLFTHTVLLSGCATPIKQGPFAKFSESAEALRDGTDKAVETLIPQNVARYKQDLLDELTTKETNELFASSRLKLKPDDPFQFESVPRYMVFDQFKIGLRSMTEAMHKYTVLLRDFADEEIKTDEEFKKLAEDLNANAFEAIRTIDKSVDQNTAENVGLISTVAAAVFNNYIRNQQKKVLIEAIIANQPTVEQYTKKAKEAIFLIAKASNHEYLNSSKELVDQMLEPNKKSIAIESLIRLNREHFTQTQALKILNNSVEKFSTAHKALKSAVNNPNRSIAHIIELVDKANQLTAMVETAKKANKNKLLEADSEQAEAQAVALETDAKLSALDAAKAQADAVIARIAADTDPGNAQKDEKAKKLEKRASQLKEMADKKAETAKLVREAVDAVKSSVQALTNS